MRVLGVDPGLTRCGIGVVDGVAGRPLVAVHVEVLRTAPAADLGERLLAISLGIEAAVAAYRPDVVVVERVFAQHNVRTVTGTAQASGLALVAASRVGIPVAMHTPSEVKAAITGSGRADKAQMTAMVMRILKLTVAPTPADAADALGLAICQIWRGPAIARREIARSSVARPVAPSARRSAAAGPVAPMAPRSVTAPVETVGRSALNATVTTSRRARPAIARDSS